MNTILVVEDDVEIARSLTRYLEGEGFQVNAVSTLASARMATTCEAILLDWNLPDGQGVELVRELRAKGINIPIIMLTARAELVDKIVGLEMGANDYLTKPFEPRELVARLRAQLRAARPTREERAVERRLISGLFKIDLVSREFRYGDSRLELTRMEQELLLFLLQNPGKVFTRDELLERVWGLHSYSQTRTVDTHIALLRQKTAPEEIETVRGYGYRYRRNSEENG